MFKTSLYKHRIYIKTNDGNTYLWNKGTNWLANSFVDSDVATKFAKNGYIVDSNLMRQEDLFYYDVDLNYTYTFGSADLTQVDLDTISLNDTFTIKAGGVGASPNWVSLVAGGAFNVVITQDVIDQINIKDKRSQMEALVSSLNNVLAHTIALVGPPTLYASYFFEFFQFDEFNIGIKTKRPCSGTGYDFTLTDTVGTPTTTGLLLSNAAITGDDSYAYDDFIVLEGLVNTHTNIDLELPISDNANQPSYKLYRIQTTNISSVFITAEKLPEVFRTR